ncbi:MAG TPA: type I 3-dehydroquinate dehydratase, partial [Chthoniobacterales bacterium]
LDALLACLDELKIAIEHLRAPVIITARSPQEGGMNHLPIPRRRSLLLEFLGRAAYVDVELQAAQSLAPVLRSASAAGVRTILSFHDFATTPPASDLNEMLTAARSLGPNIFKVATLTDTPAQLARLLDCFERRPRIPLVVAMGMGKLGRRSRLLLADRGCALNYAHLGSPTAPGQLSIPELRRALR